MLAARAASARPSDSTAAISSATTYHIPLAEETNTIAIPSRIVEVEKGSYLGVMINLDNATAIIPAKELLDAKQTYLTIQWLE